MNGNGTNVIKLRNVTDQYNGNSYHQKFPSSIENRRLSSVVIINIVIAIIKLVIDILFMAFMLSLFVHNIFLR